MNNSNTDNIVIIENGPYIHDAKNYWSQNKVTDSLLNYVEKEIKQIPIYVKGFGMLNEKERTDLLFGKTIKREDNYENLITLIVSYNGNNDRKGKLIIDDDSSVLQNYVSKNNCIFNKNVTYSITDAIQIDINGELYKFNGYNNPNLLVSTSKHDYALNNSVNFKFATFNESLIENIKSNDLFLLQSYKNENIDSFEIIKRNDKQEPYKIGIDENSNLTLKTMTNEELILHYSHNNNYLITENKQNSNSVIDTTNKIIKEEPEINRMKRKL